MWRAEWSWSGRPAPVCSPIAFPAGQPWLDASQVPTKNGRCCTPRHSPSDVPEQRPIESSFFPSSPSYPPAPVSRASLSTSDATPRSRLRAEEACTSPPPLLASNLELAAASTSGGRRDGAIYVQRMRDLAPVWPPRTCAHTTLDLAHTAVSRSGRNRILPTGTHHRIAVALRGWFRSAAGHSGVFATGVSPDFYFLSLSLSLCPIP